MSLVVHGRNIKLKLKSSLLTDTFLMSIFLLAIYFFIYWFLLNKMEVVLISHIPNAAMIWIETLWPAVIGFLPCLIVVRLSKEKRLLPLAFLWLIVYAFAILIALLFMLQGNAQAQKLFLMVYVRLIPLPIIFDGGLSWVYYYIIQKKET